MPGTVDICNLALTWLGKNTINSVEYERGNSAEAQRCKLAFDPTKESVLRDHPWNFATRIEALALVSGQTVPGWNYVYIYPKNCLFHRKVFNIATVNFTQKQPYRVIGSNTSSNCLVLCNLEQAYMEYTANVQDPTLFDASFVDAFVWKLAAQLALPLVGDANLGTKMMNTYQIVLKQAKINNASEGYQEQPQTSKYIDGR